MLVINYNGKKWLPQCLRSISTLSYPNFETYLIDNASTDGSIEYVQKNFPLVRIIKFDKNFGFAKGYNQAINQIKTDYLLLLNNDTKILKSDFLDTMVNQAHRDFDIAAIVCKMVFVSDPSIINSVGGIGIPYWRGFEDIGFREKDIGQYDIPPIEPFSFCGGATLIRTKAFIETQGFDEKFFAFFEDTDLSWRFRLKKLKIKYVPDAKIAHQYSGTYSEGPEKTYLCKRNLFRSILKNCGSSIIYWAIRNYLFFTILASLSYLRVEHSPLMAWALFKSILWNLWHLPGTYNKRQIIQNERKTSDKEILLRMYPSTLLKRREINSFGDLVGERIFGYLPKIFSKRLSSRNINRRYFV
ncbi:glycosyltransferase family 2 protein [[Eubacterium] cellulosolvens]